MNGLLNRLLLCLVVSFFTPTCFATAQSEEQSDGASDSTVVKEWLPKEIEDWQQRVQDQQRVIRTLLWTEPNPRRDPPARFARMRDARDNVSKQVVELQVRVALDNAANPERRKRRAQVEAAIRDIESLVDDDAQVKKLAERHQRYTQMVANLIKLNLTRIRRQYFENTKQLSEQSGKELEQAKMAARNRITANSPPLDRTILKETANEQQLRILREKQSDIRVTASKLAGDSALLMDAQDDLQIARDVLEKLRTIHQDL